MTRPETAPAIVRRLAGRLMDVLVPCRCLHCSAIEPGSMRLGLCAPCRRLLKPASSFGRRACDLCGGTLPVPEAVSKAAISTRCIACLDRRSPLGRLFCAFRYEEPFDAVIHGLKFQGLYYLGEHLARELDDVVPEDLGVDAVVAVPLHWRRAWARGYNQAEEIGRPLARHRGWPLATTLVRRRSTRPQSGLDRAGRRGNLRRAFTTRRPGTAFDPKGKRLLLVDDVYTTGATLEAAALALERRGASWLGAAVCGRTPDPRPGQRH